MKLSCSAYQAGSCSYAQKILSGHGHVQNYGATSSSSNPTGESTHGLTMPSWKVEEIEGKGSPNDNSESLNEGSSTYSGAAKAEESRHTSVSSHSDGLLGHSDSTGKTNDSSRSPSESPAHRSKSNQRWMKLRTTVQLSGAITSTVQKKATLKREDSFLKRFSTRQVPEAQETFEIGEDDGSGGGGGSQSKYRRKKKRSLPRSVVNPDGNFYFYWLFLLTVCVLYNLWTLIVRESFPEMQSELRIFWITADAFTDLVIFLDLAVQFRTGYLEQGLMVYKTKKLALHYAGSKHFWFDVMALLPTDFFQLYFGTHPMFRVPRFLKIYRMYNYYYIVESRTVYPNVWRVVNLIHILLLLAHWFGCFYYLLSEAENFVGPWVYPDPRNNTDYAPVLRKYLGSLYWSTLTLTTIGDLPPPYSNWQLGNQSIPFDPANYGVHRNYRHKSRLLHIHSNIGYLFTIVSYLIGVFIFATIVGQVGNVITNRNANRLEFERLLDGAKMYMRHHKVPRDMQRRVLRWYDYSWSRGRIQGGGDINTALGLLPDKLKTELALHVNLSVLKKVTIFQECQPEFLHDLVLKMKAYIFTPGDLICRKGEVAREMFIIADGILEVISETGRVLTTMQAGDFFGEIGILNLDGLNKRTADVRSVGYSELFSLSREDVLTAMKDYPEAQDILQTLGRKRLMEARKANAPAKKPEKKSPLSLLGHSLAKGPDDAGFNGDTTGKRIVEKLRSDVKGLRNAIKKSRRSNSSKEDSSEPESSTKESVGRRKESTSSLQQYAGRASIVGSMIPSSPAGRGVLKRMHNVVLSDEIEKVGIGGDISKSNLSPTILPKRVQVQFPQAEDSRQRTSSQGGAVGREVIGAGLPLIQRLRLLKQKEEKEKHRKIEEEIKAIPKKRLSSAENEVPVLSETSPPQQDKSLLQTKVSIEPPPKTIEKKVRHGSSDFSQRPTKPLLPPPTGITSSAQFQPSRPGATDSRTTSTESNTSEVELEKEARNDSALQPYRPSALRFQKKDAKNYGSIDDLSPEFSRLPFIKKLKILNERQKIAELLTIKSGTAGMLTRSTSEGSSEIPHDVPPESDTMYSVLMGRRTQSSSGQYGQPPGGRRQEPPFQLPLPSPSSSSSSSPEGDGKRDLKEAPAAPDDEPIRIPAESNMAAILSEGPTEETPSKDQRESPQASPPHSPESNETPERRHLKSILKTLAKSNEKEAEAESVDEPQPDLDESLLLKEPTIAGYAARHRKFSKNVTFQRQAVTVVSPNEPLESLGSVPEQDTEGKEVEKVVGSNEPSQTTTQNMGLSFPLELLLGMKKGTEIGDSHDFPLVSSGGLAVAQDECIGGVFLGIKNIIQARMEEFQLRFQDRFSVLEKEVRQRDEIISLLQLRIQELEDKGFVPSVTPHQNLDSITGRRNPMTLASSRSRPGQFSHGNGRGLSILENHHDEGDGYDEDSEDEGDEDEGGVFRRPSYLPESSYLFSRGDSIDTVIDSKETYDEDDDVFTMAEEDMRSASLNLQRPQVNSQWTVAERESIEMTEFSGPEIPMWQLEFHREAPSQQNLNPENPTQSQPGDSVTVEMGNTSTEYESTSSSEEEKKSSRPMKEVPIPLDDSDKSSEEEEESGEDGDPILESSESDEFDNQNWEVQMLAKEMSKREEKKQLADAEGLGKLAVDEILELDNEIQEMRDVVNSGTLSPTELDMLETMLESRTERVQALFKACSVDDTRRSLPSSSSAQTLSKPVGRSIGDFRHRKSIQCTHLPSSYSHFQRRGSRPRSPGHGIHTQAERESILGLQRKPMVRRQSSLCETRFPAQLSTSLTKRRESAGSLGLGKASTLASNSSPPKSFLSRFNFIRSLSRNFLYNAQTPLADKKRGSLPPAQLEKRLSDETPHSPYTLSSPAQILPGASGEESSLMSRSPTSSAGILPLLSSTLSSALSSSVKPESSQTQSTLSASQVEPPIFTIPSMPLPQSSLDQHPLSSPTKDTHPAEPSYTGECQPLLKK